MAEGRAQPGIHARAGGETQARERPAGIAVERGAGSGGDDFFDRRPAGVGARDNGSGADAGYSMDGDVILFEDLQDPDVRQGTAKPAAQRQADAGRAVSGRALVSPIADRLGPTPPHG